MPRAEPRGTPNGPMRNVEWRKVASLVPYARNPRLHSEEQINQIAASLREFGQTLPVVCDENGEIIAGHGRVMAAKKLGWKTISVAVAIGWSEEQKKTYRIADNQLALNATWDEALLKLELKQIKLSGFDIQLSGFDEPRLVSFLAEPSAPEQFPEVGEDISTEHSCPKCGYRWSGRADASPQ